MSEQEKEENLRILRLELSDLSDRLDALEDHVEYTRRKITRVYELIRELEKLRRAES